MNCLDFRRRLLTDPCPGMKTSWRTRPPARPVHRLRGICAPGRSGCAACCKTSCRHRGWRSVSLAARFEQRAPNVAVNGGTAQRPGSCWRWASAWRRCSAPDRAHQRGPGAVGNQPHRGRGEPTCARRTRDPDHAGQRGVRKVRRRAGRRYRTGAFCRRCLMRQRNGGTW